MKENKIKYDIGIVSLWTWENYGTNLTYYALYKVLKDMGYAVKLLERPLNSLVPPPSITDVNSCKVGLFEKSPYQPSELQVPLETRGEMRAIAEECETLMVGSDQFFNNTLNNEYGRVFHFDWVPDGKRKIVYAASWGRDEAWGTELDTKLMSYYLSRFDAFSVREKSTVDFIKKTYDRDSEFVLDPVFLCDKSHYEKLAVGYESDLEDKKYLFSYTLEPTEEKASVLNKVGEKLGLPVHAISDPHYSEDYVKSSWSIPTEMNVCEERWISLIKNSSFVVTDSFHGMCLALIFKKPFIAISNPVRGATRFESIGNLLHIEDKIIKNLEDIDISDDSLFESVDYEKIEKILTAEKSRSEKWLSDALKIEPSPERAFSEVDALKAHIEDIDLIAARNGYRISLVEKHGADVDNRFALDEKRIADVETHGANVDKRFSLDEKRIADVETHGANVNKRFEWNEQRLADSEQRIANVEKHGVDVDSRFAIDEEHFSSLQEKCSEQESRLSEQEKRLKETYNLLINTRHRTVYGACAWLFHKIFKNRRK